MGLVFLIAPGLYAILAPLFGMIADKTVRFIFTPSKNYSFGKSTFFLPVARDLLNNQSHADFARVMQTF